MSSSSFTTVLTAAITTSLYLSLAEIVTRFFGSQKSLVVLQWASYLQWPVKAMLRLTLLFWQLPKESAENK